MRIGIVGLRGASAVAGLRSVTGIQVSALCDLDAGRAQSTADELSIPTVFSDYEAMVESVDAVVVATPMHLHVPQSVVALNAGKHVLSEVTAAVSFAQCRDLLTAGRSSGATYMFSENYCYFPENLLVGALVRKGMLGEPYYGEGEYLHEVRAYHHFPDGSPTWRSRWQVGRPGCTYGTHSLGPVMQWLRAFDPSDRIQSVSCLGSGVHTDPEHRHDDTCLMLCQMRSGKLIKVRVDMMSNRPHQVYYSLQGTQGAYESGRAEGRPVVSLGAGDHRWQPLADFEDEMSPGVRADIHQARLSGHNGGDYLVAQEFARAIPEGRPPSLSLTDGLEWTAAGLCSQISILHRGAPVDMPDFGSVDVEDRLAELEAAFCS
jgi:predicted dehydrogenase